MFRNSQVWPPYAESKSVQLYNFVKSDQNATKLYTRLFLRKTNKNMS